MLFILRAIARPLFHKVNFFFLFERGGNMVFSPLRSENEFFDKI